jgi:hypothetical protein
MNEIGQKVPNNNTICNTAGKTTTEKHLVGKEISEMKAKQQLILISMWLY